jgi:sporulation protein YhbH
MRDFTINKRDWSLYGKSQIDQKRYDQKLSRTINEHLPELIGESLDEEVQTLPSSLKQHKIIFKQEAGAQILMDASLSKGDTIAREYVKGQSKPIMTGAGSQAGMDWYENTVNIDAISEHLFEELALPELDNNSNGLVEREVTQWDDISKVGLRSMVDTKRTMLQVLAKNAANGHLSYDGIGVDDLRYRTYNEREKPGAKALILMLMDTSGSMGTFEKGAARNFFGWAKRFLDTKYEHLDFEFIAHHTEAKIVDEQQFFHRGESGGTISSSVFREALLLLDDKYADHEHTVYAYYFSDGDNLTSDNPRCVELIERLCNRVKILGVGEVNQYNRSSGFMKAIKGTRRTNFRHHLIREMNDVYGALKTFFPKG